MEILKQLYTQDTQDGETIGGWLFHCPGCKQAHCYSNDGRWTL